MVISTFGKKTTQLYSKCRAMWRYSVCDNLSTQRKISYIVCYNEWAVILYEIQTIPIYYNKNLFENILVLKCFVIYKSVKMVIFTETRYADTFIYLVITATTPEYLLCTYVNDFVFFFRAIKKW